MSKPDEYQTPAATWAAIGSAARTGSASKGVSVTSMINMLLFDRLLARVFARADSPFVLKGGTRMLAFIPTARATVDIDLETSISDVDMAVSHLAELVGEDIGDRLRFNLTKQVQGPASEDQPNISMVTLTFDALGTGQRVKVDLAVRARAQTRAVAMHDATAQDAPAGTDAVRAHPEFRVPLGRTVPSPEYVMIAIERQIADKVAAMMERSHGGDGRSSRAKDLVDLALIAENLDCDAVRLRSALETQIEERELDPFTKIDTSVSIQKTYASVAKKAVMLALTWDEAEALVNRLIEPILDGTVNPGRWDAAQGRWLSH